MKRKTFAESKNGGAKSGIEAQDKRTNDRTRRILRLRRTMRAMIPLLMSLFFNDNASTWAARSFARVQLPEFEFLTKIQSNRLEFHTDRSICSEVRSVESHRIRVNTFDPSMRPFRFLSPIGTPILISDLMPAFIEYLCDPLNGDTQTRGEKRGQRAWRVTIFELTELVVVFPHKFAERVSLDTRQNVFTY